MSTENQQQRPQNCGTGHCSCIECLFEQPAQQQEPVQETSWQALPAGPIKVLHQCRAALIGPVADGLARRCAIAAIDAELAQSAQDQGKFCIRPNCEALKLALDSIEDGEVGHAAQILREALAEQPAQQPVVVRECDTCRFYVRCDQWSCSNHSYWQPKQPAQQQEPVAWDNCRGAKQCRIWCGNSACVSHWNDTSPQPASKPLTDEQIGMAFRKAFPVGGVVFTNGATEFARAIEAAHGIKGDA